MSLLFVNIFINFRWLDALDILLVAILLYQIYDLVKGSAAVNIFIGILFVYVLGVFVRALDMQLFGSILGKFIDVGVITLIIVFQQEIRRFLLFLGTSDVFTKNKFAKSIFDFKLNVSLAGELDINALVRACKNMSETKTGAIIVIARNSDLKFYTATGEQIDAGITTRMLESIFYKNSPLHDGAVIISENKIKAARCVLPVTESSNFPSHLGMRHRAAVGITENSDAIVIVVSEQTGEIAYSKGGELLHNLNTERLKEILEKDFKS